MLGLLGGITLTFLEQAFGRIDSITLKIVLILTKNRNYYSAIGVVDFRRYIRYIYNRVILENAVVRAAAVSALAQFGAACPPLLDNVMVRTTSSHYQVGWICTLNFDINNKVSLTEITAGSNAR